MKVMMIQNKTVLIDDEDSDRVSAFTWHIQSGKTYVQTNIPHPKFPGTRRKTKLRLHRFLLGVIDPKVLVDHKNGDPLDNRKENLRLATPTQNRQNRKKCTRNKSGYKGVYQRSNGKWVAQICFNKKVLVIGTTFDDPYVAHLAYQKNAIEFHGEFARFE